MAVLYRALVCVDSQFKLLKVSIKHIVRMMKAE